MKAGRLPEAEQHFRIALEQAPSNASALRGMANLLIMSQRMPQAESFLRQAIGLDPAAESYMNLGQLLHVLHRSSEGVTLLQEARQKFPGDVRVAAELARLLDHLDRTDEAAAEFESALARWPTARSLIYYYGGLLFATGNISRALEIYRKYLAEYAADAGIRSSYVFLLHFVPGATAQELLRAHQEWDLQHAAAIRNYAPGFKNDRSPDRRLRIGYVSPDFKNHGIGRFMAPIFTAHRRHQVEVFAYSNSVAADAYAHRLRSTADHWRPIYDRNQTQVFNMIREDQIDILVDLTMHMPANRLMVFAMRAAPIQITYLAYCSTTGLVPMDYRLSDPHLDPPDWDSRYTERTIRLPKSWWLYEAPALAPQVRPRDALTPLTFGSLNTLAKVSDASLKTWSDILRRVDGSRLMLHAPPGKSRRRILDSLGSLGIAEDRVSFADRVPLEQYFASHHGIDIALDPYPYGGGTTTCDALWMGVPVVTLRGDLAVGRGSASILANIGLPKLIADTPEEYVQIAADLAGDAPRREALRRTLRSTMLASPLMDAGGFIEGLEGAYRKLWQEWCSGNPA
jgi:predicted O-linked N-acetylglucosamine transferase (SPINDLY family)